MRKPLSFYKKTRWTMSLLDRLERKFGRYAIPNLMRYIVFLYAFGMVLRMTAPSLYVNYLMLDASKILQGQIWRVFTFLLQCPSNSLLFFIITLYFYYMIGDILERSWGSFRFNLYYFTGVIGTIIASLLIYALTGRVYYLDTTFINASLFLAFAFEYPDMEVLLMFILPIKMRWLAYASIVMYALNFIQGNIGTKIAIFVSLLNFILFFTSIIRRKGYSPKQICRKMTYQKAVKQSRNLSSRHKCAICGRTEKDDESLEFRYCSRCNGNYEYCQDHLFTHQHIK